MNLAYRVSLAVVFCIFLWGCGAVDHLTSPSTADAKNAGRVAVAAIEREAQNLRALINHLEKMVAEKCGPAALPQHKHLD